MDALQPELDRTVGSADVTHAEGGNPNLYPNEQEKPNNESTEDSPRTISGFKWVLVVIAVISSTFLFSLDTTIVATIQPAIVENLGHIEKLPWLSVAFAVSAAGTCLLWCVRMCPVCGSYMG